MGNLGSRLRRWIFRALRWCAALVIAICLAGAVYQSLALRHDRTAFPPPGRMVDIGTHRLHLWCRGSGEPVVLFDAGAGIWSISWQPIQDELARHTTACAFDRSGLGWSEAGPGALDGMSAARELRQLMESARLPRPFVYVGHSLGADFGQVYFGAYPKDLAGLVLIDPGAPNDLLEDFHEDRAAALKIARCGPKCAVAWLATRLGVTRLAAKMVGKSLPPTLRAWYRFGLAQPAAAATIVGYLELLPKTAYQVLAVDNYRDLPLTVVYSEKTRRPEGAETERDVEAWHARTLDLMRQLAGRSTRGRGPVVVGGATHGSVLAAEHARTVAAEIERLVEAARNGGRAGPRASGGPRPNGVMMQAGETGGGFRPTHENGKRREPAPGG
ncbi:MAG TPA: alpha/beta hydrolase [Thermoanaerobaculia bacterium]|nr:alpha/beta hydrolase [Thermoanaerobaculia bacterium]